MADILEKKMNVLRKFKHFKGWSEDELRARAIELLQKQQHSKVVKDSAVPTESMIDIESMVINAEERDFATALLDKYLSEYVITSVAEKGMLRDLLLYEILAYRLRKKINLDSAENDRVPAKMVDDIKSLNLEILHIKEKLGLVKDKTSAEGLSAFHYFDQLKKKTKAWMDANQLSTTVKCPHCQQLVNLRIRADRYEAGKHPYFKDKVLYNEHLFGMLASGKITEDDVAQVLYTSKEYIKWMLKQAERNKK